MVGPVVQRIVGIISSKLICMSGPPFARVVGAAAPLRSNSKAARTDWPANYSDDGGVLPSTREEPGTRCRRCGVQRWTKREGVPMDSNEELAISFLLG